VLTPTVKVETKTRARSAVVKNRAIGCLPFTEKSQETAARASVIVINKILTSLRSIPSSRRPLGWSPRRRKT
jgi:hypothetical protein